MYSSPIKEYKRIEFNDRKDREVHSYNLLSKSSIKPRINPKSEQKKEEIYDDANLNRNKKRKKTGFFFVQGGYQNRMVKNKFGYINKKNKLLKVDPIKLKSGIFTSSPLQTNVDNNDNKIGRLPQ